jgi:hypothetical protein
MNQAIVRIAVVVLGVIGALLLSSVLADTNFFFIFVAALGIAALGFVSIFWRYTLATSWLFLFVGFSWFPAGINLTWEELSYAAPFALMILTIWRLPDAPPELPHPTQRIKQALLFATLLWTIYVVADFGWRLLEIRANNEFGLKNVIKSYALLLIPAFLTIYYGRRPVLLSLPKNPERFFLVALSAGMALNICTRSYQNFFGGSEFDVATNTFLAGPLVIPGVNIVESIYALRVIAPIIVVFAALFATRSGIQTQARLFPAACLFLGMAGSLLGGGRATLIVCAATVAGVLILRRWLTVLFVGAIVAISFILVINVFPREIEDIGGNIVIRSVSWLIFTEGTSAQGDIEASTRWRRLIAADAIDIWTTSPRNFLIGRGFLGFSDADYTDTRSGLDYYTAIRIALQRGASHSLITDTLLAVGLLGLLLYYWTIFLGIWLGWKASQEPRFSPFTRDTGLALCFILGQRLTVGSIGGGLVGMTLDFLVIVTLLVSANRDINAPVKTLQADSITKPEGSTYAGVA